MASDYNISKWDYKNRNVDSNLDTGKFLSSARCIIYAKSKNSETEFRPIGLIQGYNWQEQKDIQMLFEVGSEVPYLVPGRTTGQIGIQRVVLFGSDLVNSLYGAGEGNTIKSLKDISEPLDLVFATFSHMSKSDTAPAAEYTRMFTGCQITSRNENVSAGQPIIGEGVNILYKDIVQANITATGSAGKKAAGETAEQGRR